MGFVFLLVQLSLLLCSTVYSEDLDLVTDTVPPIPHHGGYHHYPTTAPTPSPTHHHHHHHAPAPSPMHHAPSHPPVHPPAHHNHHHPHPPKNAPVHPPAHAPLPPFHFPRSFVAVQGVVYRKSCKFVGHDTLSEATPVYGAIVKLQCNSSKYPQEVKKATDKNGYFYVEAPHTVTNYGAHKCKVSLVSAPPAANIAEPSDLHGGVKGANLRAEKSIVVNKLPFVLYNVGPLAFEPKCSHVAPAPAPHH
ncbi:putative structural constituent of cell wall [Tripterygium wilfordii]|uniref:Putative structural constituent of cell wall n=1 Tax=Tripterygium wilfordii TaxID=458696 RepID=A0A7J7C4J0_TRIWF|nr:non-classical arabinogalactan protein 31-like [Tripterygium wilfordii]KAF5728686.1 putative structural constituent of cell wall [Tripterygium wilfordii]